MGLLDRLRRLLGDDENRRPADNRGRSARSDGPPDHPTTAQPADDPTASGSSRETGDATAGDAGRSGGETTPAAASDRDDPDRDDADTRPAAAEGTGEDSDDAPGRAPTAAAVGDDPDAFREQAVELADHWEAYDLDFTPGSLPRLDELLADQRESAGQMRVELDDGRTATLAPIAAATACYFGEVFARSYDARWAEDEDYRWALAVPTPAGGEVRLNAFGIAHEGLADAPRFAVTHDALVAEVGLDGETVADPQAEAAAARSGPAVADAEDLQAVAAEDPEVAMAAAAAGIDAEELVAGFRDDAADLVDAWPGYDLDYTPDSLERADALVRMELRESAFDDADTRFGGTDDETSLRFTVRGMRLAGYLSEVFRRHADADWNTDDGVTLVVAGPDGTAEVEPLQVAVDALREEASLSATYDGVVSRLGIDDAGIDIDPDDPDFAPPVDDAPSDDAPPPPDTPSDDGDGVSVDMDVTPEDVDVDLDPDDLDVDVDPDAREDTETDERTGVSDDGGDHKGGSGVDNGDDREETGESEDAAGDER